MIFKVGCCSSKGLAVISKCMFPSRSLTSSPSLPRQNKIIRGIIHRRENTLKKGLDPETSIQFQLQNTELSKCGETWDTIYNIHVHLPSSVLALCSAVVKWSWPLSCPCQFRGVGELPGERVGELSVKRGRVSCLGRGWVSCLVRGWVSCLGRGRVSCLGRWWVDGGEDGWFAWGEGELSGERVSCLWRGWVAWWEGVGWLGRGWVDKIKDYSHGWIRVLRGLKVDKLQMWGGCGDGGSSRSSLEICSVPVELGLAGVLKGLKGQGKGVWRGC